MQMLRWLALPVLIVMLLVTVALGEEQTTLMMHEDDEYAFMIREMTQNDRGDTLLKIRCENRIDHPLTFGWSHVSVMGCMIDPLWAATVEAESAMDTEICFEADRLQAIGIASAEEITFTLTVLDAFSWDNSILLEQEYTICFTEATQRPDRLHTDGETVPVDDDDLLLAVLRAEQTPFSGYVLTLCLENRTPNNLMLRLANPALNGESIELMWSEEIYAGKRLYTQLTIPQYQLPAHDPLTPFTFTLRLCDLNDWLLPVIREIDVAVE